MKLYSRVCSVCGRRFIGKKMDYHCPECKENIRRTTELWIRQSKQDNKRTTTR